MQYILHITKECNFNCSYCYQEKINDFMDKSIAVKLVDFAYNEAVSKHEKDVTISFYGGEPLLYKELIYLVVEHCKKRTDVKFDFKMTTNGWELDSDFINYAAENNFDIALSIDGIKRVHDKHRITKERQKTFDKVVKVAEDLLSKLPGSTAMMTVNPDTACDLFESVEYLYNLGFHTIAATPNFQSLWKDFDVLKEEYIKISNWYYEKLMDGVDVRFPLFDNKLINNVTGIIQENKCIPGKYRVSIDTDGGIYPCIQYVRFNRYKFGRINDTVLLDKKKADEITAEYNTEVCEGCALNNRCDNHCGCRNLLLSDNPNMVDPIICEHERMLIPIVDILGERLFV